MDKTTICDFCDTEYEITEDTFIPECPICGTQELVLFSASMDSFEMQNSYNDTFNENSSR